MTPRRGFNLTELLIVLGLIMALTGVLLPSLQRARLAAQSTACLANLRQITKAFTRYAEINDGYAPADAQSPFWDDLLAPHGVTYETFVCQSEPQRVEGLMGISYSWRDRREAIYPDAALSGKRIDLAMPRELLLVFDGDSGWHEPHHRNAAALDGSADSYDEVDFRANLRVFPH